MKSYSGSITFTDELERLKVNDSQFYKLNEDYPQHEDKYEIISIPITITGSSSYIPGNYCGTYEYSFPDEGETIIESVIDEAGNDWKYLLSEDEEQSILEKIQVEVEKNIKNKGDY